MKSWFRKSYNGVCYNLLLKIHLKRNYLFVTCNDGGLHERLTLHLAICFLERCSCIHIFFFRKCRHFVLRSGFWMFGFNILGTICPCNVSKNVNKIKCNQNVNLTLKIYFGKIINWHLLKSYIECTHKAELSKINMKNMQINQKLWVLLYC